MRHLSLLVPVTLLVALPAHAADPAHPTVVELFQSQGCSSCPPADHNLNVLANRPDILALSFAVTYWDQLGWKDTFAKPAFTQRQWDYAHAGGRGQVATPQMIVNGRAVVNGGNGRDVERALRSADRGAGGPTIMASSNAVAIGAGRARTPATVWLVRYDPRTLSVPIRAGENNGKTLPHRDIVRNLTALGTWTGKPVRFALPTSSDPVLRTAVFVQQGKGGAIVAAARV